MSHLPQRQPPITAERWQRLEPLLDAARDELPEQRFAFLVAACDGDDALLQELQACLNEIAQPDARLDAGVGAIAPALVESLASFSLDIPPVLAGRYDIVRELGQGGMSVVFLAYDTRLGRQVAIKVLRRDMRVRIGDARFNAEIRLTAGLRHPNIVPLFESGESEGWTFFVMPYIDGESLTERLSKVGAHSVADSIRIVTDVAAALDYAHRAGVVHRDVKPSNIMLAERHALLVDFGIARASYRTTRGFTQPGFTVGTPAYMSPEQYGGGEVIEPASDIYSLGGVLYELLTGQAPMVASARMALASHGVANTRSLRSLRPDVPVELEAVVTRAMALEPTSRYGSAAELSDALASIVSGAKTSGDVESIAAHAVKPARHWLTLTGLGALTLAAVVLVARGGIAAGSVSPAGQAAAARDSARVLLLPIEYDASVTQRIGKYDPLRDALKRWSGVAVVDAVEADEAFAAKRIGDRPLRGAEAAALSRTVHAGRYVRREVATRGGETFVHAGFYDAGSGQLLHEGTLNVGARVDSPDSAWNALADQLLVADVPNGLRSGPYVGTNSRPALQAFARGVSAVDRWDLALADSALDQAATYDSAFARAELWLAQVRVWRQRPTETWSYLVNRSLARRASLAPRDRHALDALSAQVTGDTKRACTLWETLANEEVSDFTAWYAAANCELFDTAVIRDARSPSGWRFRSSLHHAVAMLRRAYTILPAIHREFRSSWFAGLSGALMTAPSTLRSGTAVSPDTGYFMAYPSWDERGDSLLLIPWRLHDFEQGKPWTLPATHHSALQHQRELMRQIATTWRAAFPRSPDAMLAVAISLDKLGDASAVDSLRAAAALARAPDERLRIGIARVWMQVKYGLPDDLAALTSARVIAESLLVANPAPPPAMSEALASIATMIGRVSLAARLMRREDERADRGLSVATSQAASALLVFAALGGSVDSLRRLEREVEAGIARAVAPGAQWRTRERLLGRAATLAFPAYVSPTLDSVAAHGDALAAAQQSWLRHDTVAMRQHLGNLANGRRTFAPEDVKLETLVPESALLLASGDAPDALARLAATLDVQNASELGTLRTPTGAASLVRAMALRAELAARLGDRAQASRWASACLALWRRAEASLQPLVRRLDGIVGS